MNVIYQSKGYDLSKVVNRYVRADVEGGFYRWSEVSAENWDIRQGTAERDELPGDVRERADALRGQAFGAVDWPL